MQPVTNKRYYGPSLSAIAAVSVRRLAWAMGKPMSEAIEVMAKSLPANLDPGKVCLACRDNSCCSSCVFGNQAVCQEAAAVFAAL